MKLMRVCLHNILVSVCIELDNDSVLAASGEAHQGVLQAQEMYFG
jgi:hypothetical protein